MLGKEKVVNEDVEETRNKQMSFWEEIEENLEKLEKLEEEYGPFIKGNDFDPFDDEKLTTDTLRKRKNFSFLERSEMLKKRVSFFGIFCAGENIEMVYSQYDFMKNQFNKVITELAIFENKLVDASNQNKSDD